MEFFTGQTVEQAIAALQADGVQISINKRLTERWFFLTGDCNALEHGATYINFSSDGKSVYVEAFSGRDWDGYTDKGLYYLNEYFTDVCEVIEQATETVTCGYELDTERENRNEKIKNKTVEMK